jgi:hypothetical protein
MNDLRTEWTFNGVTYGFSYAVSRAWARWYLREREGVAV